MRRVVAWLLGGTLLLTAQTEIPSVAPAVRSVVPHGVQRGATAEVTFTGQHLEDATALRFAGEGVTAQILAARPGSLRARITASGSAEVGMRDFRVVTGRGTYVGVFHVGSLPELAESEPNNDPRKPQPITLPAVVNGVVDTEDWDHFRFEAKAGETLSFDVLATRNGSRLDADVAILDEQGHELAWSDDYYIFGDPRLQYRFEKTGTYVVRVGSLAGSPLSNYRLVAGALPHVSYVLPAGAQLGAVTELTIRGAGLDRATRVWLGPGAVEGTILQKTPDALRVRLTVPRTLSPGAHRLHLAAGATELPLPPLLHISDTPELAASRPPAASPRAEPVPVPVIVSGLLDRPKSAQLFEFTAQAGQRFVFQVQAMRLGSHLDPAITLLDEAGNKIAFADDPVIDERSDEFQLDPVLSYRFEKTGTYRVSIRDAMYRGGADFVYRLSILPTEPYFDVEVREPVRTSYLGQSSQVLLRVRRRGGWNQPVEVWAEGLPPGVTAERVTVAPVDSVVKDTCGVERTIDGSIANLSLRADKAQPGLYHYVVKARGQMDGRTVERTAVAHYEHGAAGYAYGPLQVQQLDVTVMPAPRLLLQLPEQIRVKPGGSATLKVTVSRFLEAAGQPLTIEGTTLPPGITAEPAMLGADAKEVTLLLRAAPDAPVGDHTLSVTARGAAAGAAQPVVVKVQP